MAVYIFRCMNGTDIILDRTGHQARSRREVERIAYAAAAEIMRQAPGAGDWSDWLVSVQDRKCSMVTVVPFPAVQA